MPPKKPTKNTLGAGGALPNGSDGDEEERQLRRSGRAKVSHTDFQPTSISKSTSFKNHADDHRTQPTPSIMASAGESASQAPKTTKKPASKKAPRPNPSKGGQKTPNIENGDDDADKEPVKSKRRKTKDKDVENDDSGMFDDDGHHDEGKGQQSDNDTAVQAAKVPKQRKTSGVRIIPDPKVLLACRANYIYSNQNLRKELRRESPRRQQSLKPLEILHNPAPSST